MNELVELSKLLSSFTDPEWENWMLFREKVESGWTIYLNNAKPQSLGTALKWGFNPLHTEYVKKPFKEDECNFFFCIDNVIGNIRPYLHKGVFFNYKHQF